MEYIASTTLEVYLLKHIPLSSALVKYQPAAQAPVLISLMIPSTVVLAIRHPVLDSRLAAVQAHVLIWRPRLLIAVRVVIR